MKQFSGMMGPKGKGGMKALKGKMGKGMRFPF
jgi:signal recognition particle subunit SRP54